MIETSRQAELIDRIADRLSSWGVAGLAGTLLSGGRPLALIGGQLLWVAQPALGLLVDSTRVADYAALLERPEALDRLVVRLEEG